MFHRNYHTNTVSTVSANKTNDNIFLSGSWDKRACIWDTREESPAKIIYKNSSSPITAITFNQSSEHEVLIGTTAGIVNSIDLRNPNQTICSSILFDAPIYRMRSNPKSNLVAVCADTPYIKVISSDRGALEEKMVGEGHSKPVRGLTWYQDCCYTSGFDGKISKFVIDDE